MRQELTTDGLAALRVAMKNIESIPEEVLDEMLTTMADVRMEEIGNQAKAMLKGPYYTGDLAQNISHSKPAKSGLGKSVSIRWLGKQHGNRRTEIAFLNEYGKKKQKARPFIKTGVMKSDEKSMSEAGKIYLKWLDENA